MMIEGILENRNKQTTDVYNYTYFRNGVAMSQVSIIFIDGNFDHCEFSFKGKYYDRYEWHALQAINQKIGEIEKTYD
jgi:hypothetical protein